jgi:hypothetical protein
MTTHEVVSKGEWVEARKRLLAKEKEFTRMRDQLSAERRALPWLRIDEDYTSVLRPLAVVFALLALGFALRSAKVIGND